MIVQLRSTIVKIYLKKMVVANSIGFENYKANKNSLDQTICFRKLGMYLGIQVSWDSTWDSCLKIYMCLSALSDDLWESKAYR